MWCTVTIFTLAGHLVDKLAEHKVFFAKGYFLLKVFQIVRRKSTHPEVAMYLKQYVITHFVFQDCKEVCCDKCVT